MRVLGRYSPIAMSVCFALLAACNGAPTDPANASKAPHAHDHGVNHSAPSGMPSASTKAFQDAHTKMMTSMTITYSGDADRDFVTGMIPHHQGAVDMAKVVLQHGKDPEIRKLAEDIIAAQEKEISQMNAWLEAPTRAQSATQTPTK